MPDRDWIGAGGGGVYSTLHDLAGYAEALLHGGANRHGRVLREETLGQMFERQYQTAPELPAMGLAFFRTDVDGHRVLSHDGILPGFNAHLAVAPDDGVAVIALTNGSSGAMRWLPSEMDRLLRTLLGVPRPIAEGGSRAAAPRQGPIFAVPMCCRSRETCGVGSRWPAGCRSSSATVARCSGCGCPSRRCGAACHSRPHSPTIPVHSDWTCRRSIWVR